MRAQLKRELTESVLLRAVYSQRQFQEVIAEFWRNHLNVDVNKARYEANHYEENVIRKFAFGKFEDLIVASAQHPAMLIYLDNRVSKKDAINENYAREIMELHTLGVDHYYTQNDVIELARVLTGWSSGRQGRRGERTYGFIFNSRWHDSQPARVMELEIDGTGGLDDGKKAILHLVRHPGTAHFISQKLCTYLVNDHPPIELVERVSKVFQDSQGDLKQVYRAIIFSSEFINPENYQAKFKTPFEFTVSALRAANAEILQPRIVLKELALMGQRIYECDVPTGYYDTREAWLDPGVFVYRWDFAIKLVQSRNRAIRLPKSDPAEWNMPTERRAERVAQMFLSGQANEEMLANLAVARDPRRMIALALGSPGFQQQ